MAMKRPACRATSAASKRRKQILDRAWSELTDAEQNDILKDLELPSNIYRNFHKSMVADRARLPEQFVATYDTAMAVKGTRGGKEGKRQQLASLCKQWMLALREETGNDEAIAAPSTLTWSSAFLGRSSWAERVQSSAKITDLIPWGLVVGQCGSEEVAMRSLEAKEIMKVRNPAGDTPKYLYKILRYQGAAYN